MASDHLLADPDRHARHHRLQGIARQLLQELEPTTHDREGLADTPRRWASMWDEFLSYDPGKVDTVFQSVQADQMVVVNGMRVWSLCEHHLLPFWCDISIGYIAQDKIIGLSKLARIAHLHAHKLQVQERLVHDIADSLSMLSTDVAVLASGEHLCMTMRGIRTPAIMRSSALRGVFRTSYRVRAEFYSLVG